MINYVARRAIRLTLLASSRKEMQDERAQAQHDHKSNIIDLHPAIHPLRQILKSIHARAGIAPTLN
jgi:hypothetical protein